MEIDIYGDLDNLDNQFEVIQEENEHLKETVQKLEETSIKFSIEINELKRINGNLEVNISSLFKTAKAEIERKNKQIAELRKDLDNLLFKRGPKNKAPAAKDIQEKQMLTKQYEKAQHDIDQKNRIIQSLNTELNNVRKELEERNYTLKRNSSQIKEENDNNYNAKKVKLEKETFVENEEDYRSYRNRHEMKENGHYNRRSKSPNFRRYNSRGRNDLRSRIDLKRLKYRRSRSREDFQNNRQNYRSSHFKGKYADRPESPLENYQNYRFNNTADDERHNYFSEHDSGVFNSQTTESSYTYENMTVSPVLSHDDINKYLEEGELDTTNLDACNVKEFEQQNIKKYTKTNKPVATVTSKSNYKKDKPNIDLVNNSFPVAEKKKLKIYSSSDSSKSEDENIADLKKFKDELEKEIKELHIKPAKNESKSDERKTENNSHFDSGKYTTNKNEKKEKIIDTSTSSQKNLEHIAKFTVNETSENVKETKKTETTPNSEIKPAKGKSDKTKVEKKSSDKDKSRKEKDKHSKTESKSTKSKNEKEKQIEKVGKVSEMETIDIKTDKSSTDIKDTNISVVSELISTKIKKQKPVSESTDSNIKIVSQLKPNTTKSYTEIQILESSHTNISFVTESPKAKIEKINTEPTGNKSVASASKTVTNIESPLTNLTLVSGINEVVKSDIKLDISKPVTIKQIDETNISESQTECSSNTALNNLQPNESENSNIPVTTSNIESQNLEPACQQNDRKPAIRGRRRRCVISIT